MAKQVKPDVESFARIRVVGVGGSGGNAINHMVSSHVQGVDFIAVNTDAQDLHKSKAKKKIHIGKTLTRGLGTGMNSDIGKQAAEETREEIQEALKGSDMVFITCGMGGGTGTGAAPIVAKVARELGALTVGVVTKPFGFEGAQRLRLAETGIAELRKAVDAVIIIPNDKLLAIVSRDTGIRNAFAMCDDILKQAVEGISDLITQTGIVNVDFADVRTIMHNTGSALMGIGTAIGEKRAESAARAAINSPLLEVSISGAKGVLFSIAGGEDLGMLEVQDAASVITEAIDPEAKVIFGAVTDDSLKKGQVRVTVIATGFPETTTAARPLFGTPQRLAPSARKQDDLPPVKSARKPDEAAVPEETPLKKDLSPAGKAAPEAAASVVEDDDTWGLSFLKRR
ncbi:cell division protein FtsZ [Candidatus Kaiserbacteria bacterium CG10_big_fil_rev_8_21_14_0_10_59_10]|uniref:Cell division protein FtsZ n=1 Tax=Candidatus Kaiserbacteria bacterium CG10_big_fil_rev_8_21_14_0_10_59_10 TaxID=1974612 RepID=A0A2H0U8F8_9BACT|nr:MAG: cell division protein FtsZ [Candidatus Kaiserbacteria bacterium CG10_big_fil_rev_8_21_14_0_10_59_10]